MSREKTKQRPDMELQTAVPVTPPSTSSDEEDETLNFKGRARIPAISDLRICIPKGMLPNNSRSRDDYFEREAQEAEKEKEEARKIVSGINYNMLFILAAGIGLGVLICYKGYDYVAPALNTATSIVDETVSETISE